MPSVRAGRSITRPNAPVLPADRARAALLGWNPTSSAIARIRSLVAAETPGWPFSAKETAALVTPARCAMSVMVGRFIGPPGGASEPLGLARGAAARYPG